MTTTTAAPPHDLSVEQGVLGSRMLDWEAISLVCPTCDSWPCLTNCTRQMWKAER